MTDKELKRLSRSEILELLLLQTQETERLRKELAVVREQLANRQMQVAEAGNLAEAVLAVNGVMEAAQAAAQQYLDNIAAMEQETRHKCDMMLQLAHQRAREIHNGTEQHKE